MSLLLSLMVMSSRQMEQSLSKLSSTLLLVLGLPSAAALVTLAGLVTASVLVGLAVVAVAAGLEVAGSGLGEGLAALIEVKLSAMLLWGRPGGGPSRPGGRDERVLAVLG